MKRIVPREEGERDIDEIADYYTDEAGEDIARGFADAVRDAYRVIGERPGMGPPRYAHLISIGGLRSRKLHRFPFLIFYIERGDHVDVWRVLHAKRDIPAWLEGVQR